MKKKTKKTPTFPALQYFIGIMNRYIMFGRGICEKYQSRDENISTAQREKKLNPHTNTSAAVKMNEINPKYENTPAINQSKSRILI